MANKITVEEIKAYMKNLGYVEDRYGNLRKESGGKIYRFKFQDISVRFEHGYHSEIDGKLKWVKVGGDYFKNIRWHEDGRLIIGSKIFRKGAV